MTTSESEVPGLSPAAPSAYTRRGGDAPCLRGGRVAATLGADVLLCCALGGEPGRILGMAAGALNATRRGLGTGTRQEIERLAAHVSVRPAQETAWDRGSGT